MSTADVSMDPADQEQLQRSDSDIAVIVDLTMWHTMPYFSAQQLTQLNCKRWPVWNPYTMKCIDQARREDDTRDWYFPLFVKKMAWPSWSGMWHSTADQVVAERVHSLPPMTCVPHEWTRFSLARYHILAASGGLLLMKAARGSLPLRRSSRLNPRLLAQSSTSTTISTRRRRSTWQRLLVCNPLTKECRELPAPANSQDVPGRSSWNGAYFKGVQAHMVVDEEAKSYQVILTFTDFVYVYTSTSDTWACFPFPAPRPWGRSHNEEGINSWGFHSASAHTAGGRLYFADIQSRPGANAGMDPIHDATPAGALRLFEMEAEAGSWSLLHTYSLGKSHLPFLNRRSRFPYDMGIIQFFELVECKGDLFAVIPARLDEVLTVGRRETSSSCQTFEVMDGSNEIGTELECMPLVFYIIQLQPGNGAALDHGVLRIQIPHTRRDICTRRAKLYQKTFQERQWCWNFFSCHARGSVIWVSCDDYLLQYDVKSRESKTQLIPQINTIDETLGSFAYRPSFHMKP